MTVKSGGEGQASVNGSVERASLRVRNGSLTPHRDWHVVRLRLTGLRVGVVMRTDGPALAKTAAPAPAAEGRVARLLGLATARRQRLEGASRLRLPTTTN
jgi:hypothetical protein